MHGEYSMADGSSSSCNVLNRIIRKINKRRMKYVSKIINTRKNTCCFEQEFAEVIGACVQDLGMLLDYNNTTIDDIDAKMNTLVLLDHDAISNDIDAKMNTLVLVLDHDKKQSSTWLQQLVLLPDDAFPQDQLDDMLLDYNTTTTTTTASGNSNGDEDLMSSQQQQQPPAVSTSEGEEDNLSALLWPLDFQVDDYQEIDNLYSSSLDFQIKELLEIGANLLDRSGVTVECYCNVFPS